MKDRNLKFTKRVRIFGVMLLAFMAILCIATDVNTGIGVTVAMAGVVAAPQFTEKETAFLDHVKSEVGKNFEKFEKGYISETKFNEILDAKMKGWLEKKPEMLDEIKQALETQGLEIKKMTLNGGGKITGKSIADILNEKKPELTRLIENGEKLILPLNLKTTVVRSGITSDPMGLFLADIGQMKSKRTVIADLFSQFPMGADSHGVIHYIDQTTATRNAAARTEGNASAESVLAWTGYTANLREITDSIPISKEMLRDVQLAQAEIENFIINNLMLKVDQDLVTGDGSPPNIKGIYTYATAFVPATYVAAGKYQPVDASLYDLIVILATEIMSESKYFVDTVILNPSDVMKMKLKKDSNNNYVVPPFVLNRDGANMMVDNIKVVSSASQTINTLTIGDFTKARRYFAEQINLEFGYNLTGDFAKRILTLLGNVSELLLVRHAEENAFLSSTDIASDLAAINYLAS